jgi:hypothetical protein
MSHPRLTPFPTKISIKKIICQVIFLRIYFPNWLLGPLKFSCVSFGVRLDHLQNTTIPNKQVINGETFCLNLIKLLGAYLGAGLH